MPVDRGVLLDGELYYYGTADELAVCIEAMRRELTFRSSRLNRKVTTDLLAELQERRELEKSQGLVVFIRPNP